jgi:hypothetical protein
MVLFQRDLTGIENLEEVHYLELRVDTRDTSLGNFGSHVPNLMQLKLSNSIIACVRYWVRYNVQHLFANSCKKICLYHVN